MTQQSLTHHSNSPDETCAIARGLAGGLKPGDVLLLSGDVGAGKSHFARCLILASLPQPEDVPSPTYTLVQTYEGPECDIWHADLYRLSDVAEVDELGLFQAFDDAICLVEWPDRIDGHAPSSALSVAITPGPHEDARTLQFTWTSDRWSDALKGMVHA